MKTTLTILFSAILLLGFATSEEKPPNVILIFADDLGYGDVGCYGATKVKTPNIDKLAEGGRRFTDAHSASAVCTPSRYGLLTGEYPMRAFGGKGSWGPLPASSPLIISKETPTIGKVFQQAGYATSCFGKWHLGFGNKKNDWSMPLKSGPNDVGFDHYWGLPLVNSGSPYVLVENNMIVGYEADDPLVAGKKPISPTPTFPKEASKKSANRFGGALKAHSLYDDEKMGDMMVEQSIEWLDKNKEKPFFMYFATTHIHHPFTPAPRFKGTSEIGLYGDYIHELDWMVGELTGYLEKNGLTENTLVIFTSDNGGMMNLGGRIAVEAGHKLNGDLLGFKFGSWEGGHRVPFIAKWPEKIEAGTVSNQLISSVDMLATFAELTNQEVSMKGKDSHNVLSALTETPSDPVRPELLTPGKSKKHVAFRKGKWLYISAKGAGGFTGSKPDDHAWGGPPAVEMVGGVNSDIENGKLKKDAPNSQLYDMETDFNQTKNVVKDFPEVAAEMKKELAAKLNTYK